VKRFVVGTGRCGSTLLSRMLAEHEDVTSLFEFFTGLDWGKRFAPGEIDGSAFADLICAEQPFVTAVLRRGYEVEEIVYPFERGRYRRDAPLPWILVAMLPRLTGDPDALYDRLRGYAAARPRARLAEHYVRLFDWLTAQAGGRTWIERSGSSIEYLESLYQAFPGARFVHIHRNGPEAALSMREHHAYRLPIALLYDAPLDDGRRPSELGPIDWSAEAHPRDPISSILASRPPAHFFGRYWSDQVVRGSSAVSKIAADAYMEVGFDALVSDPRAVLAAIADFFLLPPGAWVDRAAALVHGAPRRRAAELPEGERKALLDACAPGMRILGQS